MRSGGEVDWFPCSWIRVYLLSAGMVDIGRREDLPLISRDDSTLVLSQEARDSTEDIPYRA